MDRLVKLTYEEWEAFSSKMSKLEVNKKDLQQLYDEYKNIERVGRLIAENLFLGVTQRLDSFMHQSPEQRYMDLVNRNAEMLQRVPQYHIAAYLGVSPETLSRIRKRAFS